MADWKQITARIRRARTGKDPATQLSNLFAKTRDAMVAFELARYFESIGNNDDAGKWYLSAAERFRRSDWKTKAQESATRLGATVAAEMPAMPVKSSAASETDKEPKEVAANPPESETSEVSADPEAESAQPASATRASSTNPASRRSPRGRRGGRDIQRGRRTSSTISPAISNSALSANPATSSKESPDRPAPATSRSAEPGPAPGPSYFDEQATAEPLLSGLRGRSGHPGLSSRLSQMEMNFRRLLASAPLNVEDASQAPAGPGVWVLADADQSTYYYVESCQTLRVAIGHILRGTSRSGSTIKPQLAEHLGIPETRVSKYLSDHCAVRWLQMDEGAAHFAHFLISVLHPILND
jgi:hypothetical protein